MSRKYFDNYVSAIENYVSTTEKKIDEVNTEIFHLIIDTIDKNMKYILGGIPVANFYKSGISGMSRDGWTFYTPSPIHVGKSLLDVLCRRDSKSHISRKSFSIYELTHPYMIDGTEFVFTIYLEHVPEKFFDTYDCFIDAEILGKKVNLASEDFIRAWTYFIFAQPNLVQMWKSVYEPMNVKKHIGTSKNIPKKNLSRNVRVEKSDVVLEHNDFIAILRTGKTDNNFGTRTTFKKQINGKEYVIPLYYMFGNGAHGTFVAKNSPATLCWALCMEKMATGNSALSILADEIFATTTLDELLTAEQPVTLFQMYREKKWDSDEFKREIGCDRSREGKPAGKK